MMTKKQIINQIAVLSARLKELETKKNKQYRLLPYSVEYLRKVGYKVRILEERLVFLNGCDSEGLTGEIVCQLKSKRYIKENNLSPLNKGGRQTVQIRLSDGREVVGVARTSVEDNFNRKFGLKLAITRALEGEELELY